MKVGVHLSLVLKVIEEYNDEDGGGGLDIRISRDDNGEQ